MSTTDDTQSQSQAAATTTRDTPTTAERPAKRVREVRVRALTDFENSRELVFVMRDAILAHKRLYEDAHVLHGDINPNTIVIFEDPPSTVGDRDAAAAAEQEHGERARARGYRLCYIE
ncbi:hypothetical protein FKP32DRAFT_1756967 [Trametes sanguinea]|nr:hypothetical protein FKP32DRAFT_1756967 [Trametes sanguinea]